MLHTCMDHPSWKRRLRLLSADPLGARICFALGGGKLGIGSSAFCTAIGTHCLKKEGKQLISKYVVQFGTALTVSLHDRTNVSEGSSTMLRNHFIHCKIKIKSIVLKYVPTNMMLAEFLKKAVGKMLIRCALRSLQLLCSLPKGQ